MDTKYWKYDLKNYTREYDYTLYFIEEFCGFGDSDRKNREPSIVVTGNEPATSNTYSINETRNDGRTESGSYANKGFITDSDDREIKDFLSPLPEEIHNGYVSPETPKPMETKEQKKSFMKMMNERMKRLSETLQVAVKNYYRLAKERNTCLQILGVKPQQEGISDDMSLEKEIKRVIEETGYEPKSEQDDDQRGYNGDEE